MPETTWRPASEADAVSTQAVFLEWLSAMRGITLDGFAALAAWRRAEPSAFFAAISEFAGFADESDVRAALLRGNGSRTALVILTPGLARPWSRAELSQAHALPWPTDRMVASLAPSDLPALAASHLLDADTRPDTRLLWACDSGDPWPLGAWLVGANVMLALSGNARDLPAADRATIVRAAPKWRG